jgi:hypothetical protein
MKVFIYFALLASPVLSWAGWNIRNNLELAPQYRHLNQHGFSDDQDVIDFFGMLNSDMVWSAKSLSIEAKPEIRAVQSKYVQGATNNAVSVKTSQRALHSRFTLAHEKEFESYLDFDRLNLKYTFTNGEAFAGRKPVSLGVLRFFPLWNKLTLPLIFQPGPEWIENPDVVGANYQLGRFNYRAFASRGNTAQVDDIVLGEVRFFGKGIELQALGGYWWQHTAIGIAAAIDAFSSTIRLESLYLGEFRNEKSQVQIGVGIERAIDAKWTFVTEALYQSAGVEDFKNLTSPPNRFMALSGKSYLLPYFTYQMNPLWILNFGALAGFSGEMSYVAIGGFEHSLNDNTSLNLKVKWPLGSRGGEFGDQRIDVLGRTAGMSSTAFLQLQTTF